LQGNVQDALDDLRELARGIYPPLLADRGPVSALEAQGGKATLATRLDPYRRRGYVEYARTDEEPVGHAHSQFRKPLT